MTTRSLIAFLIVAVGLYGQTAQTSGRVADPTGSVVVGARISMDNVDTGVRSETTTNEQGYYLVPALRPGNYNITVQKEGFRPVNRTGIHILADERVRLDFDLEIGTLAESINVVSDVPLLKTDSAEMSTSITGREYNRLPLIQVGRMRSPANFLYLTPGVHGNLNLDGTENNSATNQVQVNGGLKQHTELLVDGLPASVSSFNEMSPPVDAILEFKVQGSQMSAEYGRTGAAVVNFTIKSGTNDLHGGAFHYLRNDKLDARNFFAPTRALTRQNEFGMTLGGPVYVPKLYSGRDRTFFFFTYSGARKRGMDNIERVRIPTPEFVRGDFSRLFDSRGNVVPIFDPQTTRPGPQTGFVRDRFPGNVVPASRIDPVSAKVAQLYPAPNLSGAGALNFQEWIGEEVLDPNVVTAKVDHSFNMRQKLFVTFNWNEIPRLRRRVPLPDPINDGFFQNITSRMVRLNHDFLVSPALFNNLVLGYNRFRNPAGTRSAGHGWPEKLGLVGVPGNQFPVFSFTNGYATAGSSGLSDGITQTFFFKEALTWTRGSHILKFGAELRYEQPNSRTQSNSAGTYSFNSLGTGLPGNSATGDGFASFMLGQVHSSSLSFPATSGTRRAYHGFYAQDDFKLTPTLTINLGFRFEYERAPFEAADRYSVVDLTVPNPGAGNLPGAMIFAGKGPGRNGRRMLTNTDYSAWGPRFGFSWRAGSKSVVRGGYGIYYANSLLGLASTVGFNVSANFATTDNGITPAFILRDGIPQTFSREPRIDPAILNNQNAPYTDGTSGAMPRTQNWSLGIQRELSANFLLEATYIANHNTRQADTQMININQLEPRHLQLGALLSQSVTSAAARSAGIPIPYAGFSGSVAQALRAYPQYRTLTAAATKAGSSMYHGMELRLRKRLSWGLSFDGSYTLSKNIGYNSPSYVGRGGADNALQDHFNRKLERAILPHDITNALLIHYAYDLPLGRGRLRSGWNVSGIHRYQSGNPLPIFMTNSLPIFNRTLRPNVVPGVKLATGIKNSVFNPNSDVVINPAALSRPAAFQFGNAAPYYQELRNFFVSTEDLSLNKETPLTEKLSTEFYVQFINAFNRHRYGEVDANFNNASFGRVKSASLPRFIQLGLRFKF